MYTVGQKMAQG